MFGFCQPTMHLLNDNRQPTTILCTGEGIFRLRCICRNIDDFMEERKKIPIHSKIFIHKKMENVQKKDDDDDPHE
ncbi:hypothetical protein DERP_002785 [Dermatophagoides pteronyssinus]|uniref:Uncharacterized protein n=1 Tax=Dermatophagoides pteronyssinus TaxID=6956 RepID=A0ABQ8JWM1_DERPT|nr:hypothetical protein DERP_002785 [Dermatophagoides pteronyssinus]